MIFSNRSPFRVRTSRLAYRNGERGNSGGQTGTYVGLLLGAVVGYLLAPATGGASAVLASVALGAAIGSLAGGIAGNLYDTANAPDNRQVQQSLSDLKIQTSTYAQVIPQIIGQFGGNAGNVFWSTDKVEHQHSSHAGGGKGLGGGGGAQITVTKTYTVSMAIGICDTRLTGPVVIEKIWKDLSLLRDNSIPGGGGEGGIAAFDYAMVGNGYAKGDTGIIAGGGNNATYVVTAVGGAGVILSIELLSGGSGYEIGIPYPLTPAGEHPGVGHDATILPTALRNASVPNGWTFYPGTADQLPDATIEAALGVGNVPGYHYLAYVVIQDDDLGASGAVHNYTFQVRQMAAHNIQDVIGLLCDAAGIDSNHRDVSALPEANVNMALVSIQAIRAPLQELAQDVRFYAVESGRKLKFRPLGAGDLIFTIPQEDMDATEDTPQVRGLLAEHVDEVPLPTELDITYIDPAMNWQNNTQRTMLALQTGSLEAPRTLTTTVALSADQAKQLSQEAVYEAWIQRETLSTLVGRKWSRLEPGDRGVLRARSLSYGCVLSETTYGRPGIMELTALLDAGFVRNAPAPPPGIPTPLPMPLPLRRPTHAFLLNLPALTSSDITPRYYVIYTSESSPWPGAVLFRSLDGETTYSEIDVSTQQATTGLISDIIFPADWHVIDEETTFEVVLDHGELLSISDLALENGGNLAAIVDDEGTVIEMLSFAIATLTAPATYTVSRLWRGRLGTEDGVDRHTAGERFVLLDTTAHRITMDMSERYVSRPYKSVTVGFSVSNADVQAFTPTAENLRPWSVAQPAAELAGADWALVWRYRSRYSGAWVDFTGIAFDIDFAGFQIEIYADGTFTTLVRTMTTDGGTPMDADAEKAWLYDEASQVADFGSPQTTLHYRILSLTLTSTSDGEYLSAG